MRSNLWLLSALYLAGCGTLMRPTKLSVPVQSAGPGVRVTSSEVHVSADVRGRDLSVGSRVLVVLDLDADAPTDLDLRRFKLGLQGVGAPDEWRTALASGVGEAPELLSDGEHASPIHLEPGQHVRAWVAFGQYHPRAQREIPEHVVLVTPGGTRVALSTPGAEPIWHGEPVKNSQGLGLLVQASADESAVNLLIEDQRFSVGPVVAHGYLGFGVRMPAVSSRNGQDIVCCNIAFGLGASWPLARIGDFTLAPYAGAEGAVLASKDDVSRRTWIGPAVGLELSGPPLWPRHGAFPIDYPRSSLGALNVRAALVHWFGPDRSPPSFGATLAMSIAYGD